tara:strand:+ start:19 stop:930 length:912 start_codon:yes stop_codon:yes gene_type:complete
MTDLLEIYNRSFDTKDDKGIKGPPTPGSYLGSNPGPMPPRQSPLEKEYDLENNNQFIGQAENGGAAPNDSDAGVIPTSGFIQRYTSTNAYYTDNEGIVRANISTNDLVQSTAITGLDVENSAAGSKQGGTGGPINDPKSNFTQNYGPENPFYTNNEGIVRATDGESPLTDTFKTTGLDVENPEAGVEQGGSGGPNRTSAANGTKSSFLDGGNYKNLRYPTRAKFIDNIEGEEDAGTLSTSTLQQYTPNRTYLEILADPSLEIEAVISNNIEQPAEGGIPDKIDESMLPKDVAPKINDLKNFNI